MELKERKFINNTGKLPGFADGGVTTGYKPGMWNQQAQGQPEEKTLELPQMQYSIAPQSASGSKTKSTVGNWQNAAMATPGLVGSIANSWTNYDSEDEILAQYHPQQRQVAGIQYDSLIKVKDGKLPGFAGGSLGNVAGAAGAGATIGSVAGPLGAVIGGLAGGVASGIGEIFSADKQARRERNIRNYVTERNAAERSGALGQAMQIFNAKQYGDQGSQLLYGIYKDGKLPGYDMGKVATAFGEMIGEPNAKVSNGEVIAREIAPGQFSAYRVPGMKNNKDGKLALLGNNDYVITNKNGASDIAAAGNIEGGINHMMATGKPSYKCGKLPGHAEGWLGNFIPSALGSIAGLAQYFQAKNNKPYYPRTYSSNPYEVEALNTLAGLNVNPYPIMHQLRNAEARTNRAIDMSGGLSGGQRTISRMAALNTTQNNIANTLSNIQQQNNAYKSKYAEAALNAGQQARTARMAANQWDLDYYSKAHAARNKGMQTGIANMLAQIQQYQANEFKRRQFNETMDLYRADQKQRNQHNAWMRNYYASQSQPIKGIGLNASNYDPTNPNIPTYPGQQQEMYMRWLYGGR